MLKNSSPGSWASPSMHRCPRLLCVIRRPGRLPTLARWSSSRLLCELAMRSKNSSVCGDAIREECAGRGRGAHQGHISAHHRVSVLTNRLKPLFERPPRAELGRTPASVTSTIPFHPVRQAGTIPVPTTQASKNLPPKQGPKHATTHTLL